MFAKPNIYCHFAQGMGEPKYLPVPTWPALNKLLGEALDSYNEVNAAMSLVSALLCQLRTEAALAPQRCSCGIALAQFVHYGAFTAFPDVIQNIKPSPPVFFRCSLKMQCLIFAELVGS